MRKARTLLLLAAALAATLALAPSASAQAPTLEVTDEANGMHCPAVTVNGHTVGGGCKVHLFSTEPTEVRKHVMGMEFHVTRCDMELTLLTNEDADGFIAGQMLSGMNCTHQACAEAGGAKKPWQVHGYEDTGVERLRVGLCIRQAGGAEETCLIDIPFTEPVPHRQELGKKVTGVVQEIPGGAGGSINCELVAHWHAEAQPDVGAGETAVEIVHVT